MGATFSHTQEVVAGAVCCAQPSQLRLGSLETAGGDRHALNARRAACRGRGRCVGSMHQAGVAGLLAWLHRRALMVR